MTARYAWPFIRHSHEQTRAYQKDYSPADGRTSRSISRATRAEATHEQSKAENKYDTRGPEASYLARGQSRQAAEIQAAIAAFEKLDTRKFGAGEPIDVGAFVELKLNFAGAQNQYRVTTVA